MVGHTGFTAARIAVEVVDLCLGRILEVVDEVESIGCNCRSRKCG